MSKLLYITLIILLFSCKEKNNESGRKRGSVENTDTLLKTGGVRYIRLESGHQIWTKKVGNGPVKVLLLHDGPGLSHDYLQCFEDFIPGAGIEIYYYDQLGCGNSDNPSDTTLWNISRFRDEVEEVRKALGLEQFYLYGHGWGGMLALEYLTQHQENLRGVILSNAAAGINSIYRRSLLKKYLSSTEYQKLDSLSQKLDFNSPLYNQLLYSRYFNQTFCRLNPWPAPVLTSIAKTNRQQFRQMMGDDVFSCRGNLTSWQRWDTLKNLSVPALIIGGMKDEVDPTDVKELGRKMPNSRTVFCEQGSKMSMFDDQPHYFRELIRFLKESEEGVFSPDPLPES